eukprot:TRINITY_DN1839_c0_g1_i1.p1 TRINITY_DN1839_c0_g1~~TRINITY_DN1839_c0_g1_i1.p1  ORF type:complete len:407 (+),score=94.19 TRINITY_DN1839_c0_g1_i1:213-1433(+)
MSLRCLSVIAAFAQPAVAINSKLFQDYDAAMTISVQERQYAMLYGKKKLGADLILNQEPASLLRGLTAREAGEAAALSEEGYSTVANMRSKEAMDAFADRLLKQEGLEVTDVDMLNRVLPFYNGECAKQSFDALRQELSGATSEHGCKKAWVKKTSPAQEGTSLLAKASVVVTPQGGDVAPLDEDGYQAVVALKNNEEMKKFIRRLSQSHGLNVMNEGGLSGFAPYYSGVCATQTFQALVTELKSVQPVVEATSVSYELQPGEDIDHLKERIAAATGLWLNQIDIASDDGNGLDAAQMKTALAYKLSVEENRINVINDAGAPVQAPADAAQPDEQASQVAPVEAQGTTRVVVTITSANGVSVVDALKALGSDSSSGVAMNGDPVTMVASIPKPESCGGGWVAPHQN